MAEEKKKKKRMNPRRIHYMATQSAIKVDRTLKILDLKKQGWTQTKIAKHLGITQPCVSQHLKQAMSIVALPKAEEVLKLELQRLDDIHASLWTAVTDPSKSEMLGPEPDGEDYDDSVDYKKAHGRWEEKRLKAIRELLRIHELRVRLFGLASQKHDVNIAPALPQEAVKEPIIVPKDLSDEALDKLAKKLEEANARTIDVKARVRDSNGQD